MKKTLIGLLLVFLLIIATACGATEPSQSDNGSGGYSPAATSGTGESTLPEDGELARKIIKNGELELEAEDVNQAYANILAFAEENGGYEFAHNKTARGSYFVITATIKIAPEKLDALMNYAGNAASVINSTTSSEDITSDYYDAQTRLETKRKSLENYYTYLEQAQSIDESIKIQNQINALTEEIEALEGQLKLWNSQVDESTLELSINQINDPAKPKKDIQWNALSWSDMGTLIKNGFISVTNVLVSVLQWLVIVLIALSPLLAIAGIVLFFVLRARKKKKARLQKMKEAQPPTQPPAPPAGSMKN